MHRRHFQRSAGILMHITSLPGRYGIGDIGPEAYKFVRMLKHAGMHFWQILPVNPFDVSRTYSPYSPLSSLAGNTLILSPDLMVDQKLIDRSETIKRFKKPGHAHYEKAEKFKRKLIDHAYTRFKKPDHSHLHESFQEFCHREKYWLDDYVMFITLKHQSGNSEWQTWPPELRDRDPEALKKVHEQHAETIEREKFAQFLFHEQWHALKKYCSDHDIEILGDVPIYISHDSADVWAHPEYFKLTEDKSMAKVAGVPPDYFNDKGQLWNMPVYNWDLLRERGYDWWIERIRKNLELFHVVRLDHFRGFSSYWEVDGGAENAINGQWIQGPGKDIFETIKHHFPEMPFIAEDLGDVDQPVYDLRDRYHLPGMLVLQFAFGNDMPKSIFIPHHHRENAVVYTGTHDNNTVKGWYNGELGKKGRKNLQHYLTKRVTNRNCHKELVRLAFKSVARIAVIPMQDILGLGEEARMNFPSTTNGNWLWRMTRKEPGKKIIRKLKHWAEVYDRLLN
jgi:4-alpha-glucanotransferase